MPLARAVLAKIAVGTSAAAVIVGGAATITVRHDQTAGGVPGRSQAGSTLALVGTDGGGLGGSDVVVDPITGTVRLVPRAGGAGASSAGAAGANWSAGSGSQPSARAQLGGSANGTSRPGGPAGSSGGSSAGGDRTTGGGTGGSSSGGAGDRSPGGSGGSLPGVSDLSAPSAPSTPQGVSAHSHGSFTVAVPGTGTVSKRLCLSGTAVNKCQTITVPAVQPVNLTLSFAGSTGAQAPEFTPGSCPGGASVTVSGLTPGATVTVGMNGNQLSATVSERGASQTASLCDG
jgi:hypothetical protein